MQLAIIGYGRMGKAIERLAEEAGHRVVARVRATDTFDGLNGAEVAVEFTRPEAAVSNLKRCFSAGIPVVSGTTGWLDAWDDVTADRVVKNGGLFYASNFAIGVNLFFDIAKNVAQSLDLQQGYSARIEEIHHIHKLDAPSGTAITLAEHVLDHTTQKTRWELVQTPPADTLGIQAQRTGEVIGTHRLIFESELDTITLEHRADSRDAFAKGALRAAEFMVGKSGLFSMDDLINH